mgnify:CR=1 FL=1
MPEPIRILHMIGSLNIGGSQSMIINLHKAIDRSKVQFDYIIDHPGHLYYGSVVKSLGGKIFEFPTFKGHNFLQIRKAWKQFFKDHPEYKILHSHVRSYASLYLPLAKKAGLKTIIHSHSTSNGKGLGSVVKRIMQYPLRWQADYFFGCSKEAGAWLFGDKIVNSPKFHILQNAIDTEQYKFNPEIRKEYREKLGLGDKKTFIHVGRFHPAKNHVFLLNVFSEIHKQDANTVLLLAGDGELRPKIERRISVLGLKNDVLLLGSRSDVPRLLQAADCFLFPSFWEGFGMGAIEAQAAGLPCVCSDSIPQSVKVTDYCVFFHNDKAREWAEMALHLILKIGEIPRDTSLSIVKCGFDIKESSNTLCLFYQNNWRNQ